MSCKDITFLLYSQIYKQESIITLSVDTDHFFIVFDYRRISLQYSYKQ